MKTTNILIQKAQLIHQPSFINKGHLGLLLLVTQTILLGHLDKLRKCGSLDTPCHSQKLAPIILQLKTNRFFLKMQKSLKEQHLANVHPEIADWSPIEVHGLPHHCVPLPLKLFKEKLEPRQTVTILA